MMKKIFSKYFVVAVVAVAMGCISSCKDFEDEMYSALDGQDASLRLHLMDEIARLKQEMKDSLENTRERHKFLQDSLDAYIEYAEKTYATKAALEDSVENLRDLIENGDTDLQGKLNKTNARIDSLNGELTDSIIPNIESNLDSIGKVSGRLAELETEFNKLDQTYAKITYVDDKFKGYYTKTQVDSLLSEDELAGKVKDIINGDGEGEEGNGVKDAIQSIVYNMFYGDSGSGTPMNLSGLKDSVTTAYTKALANEATIKTLQEQIEKIKQCNCPVLIDRVVALEEKMDSIEEVCAAIEANYEILESRVDTLSGIEETKALAYQAQQKAEQYAKEYTDKALDAILDYVNPRFTSVEEMLAEFYSKIESHADQLLAHDAEIAALKDSINLLRADLTELRAIVEQNTENIENLTERVEDIENALAARISSVVLQATKSPVVGYFNIPMGIKSNVLAAYYGEAMNDVYFPTIRTANLISGEAFTDAEAALLRFNDSPLYESGETLIDEAEGNAGTLYVTINPAEVDLTGVDFSLVNSLDDTSYVALGEYNKSSEKLSFGYTRADNGFYEFKATISAKDAANAKLRVNYNDVKSLASELKNIIDTRKVNLTSIATDVQSIVNDIADATAVKASWEDKMGVHNVYSEYALAAVAVQPLSYQFMQNFEMKNFPGITRVSNFINSTIDKINIALPKFDMDFTAPEIKKIQIKDFDELGVNCLIEMTVDYELNLSVPVADVVVPGQEIIVPGTTITIPEQEIETEINGEMVTITVPARDVTVDGQKVKVDGTTVKIANVEVHDVLQIPVKYDMTDIIKDLYGNVTEPIEDVNAMLADLEVFMDDVNKMLEELDTINDLEQSITDAKNDIKSQLNKYLDLLNNKLCGVINSVHDRLQPNLLLKTEDGFAMLSQVKNRPTVLDAANCVVVPTSYTGELLVPALKKYVAVVNVKDAEGNDVTSSEIASVNTGDLNKVLAGSTTAIEFAGKSGYTYEIVYSALDYSGKYSNARYYVTVK